MIKDVLKRLLKSFEPSASTYGLPYASPFSAYANEQTKRSANPNHRIGSITACFASNRCLFYRIRPKKNV